MNMYDFLSFFTRLVNVGGVLQDIFNAIKVFFWKIGWVFCHIPPILGWAFTTAALFVDSLMYKMISFTYGVFELLCTINMDSLATVIKGFTDKVQALIIVLVIYKLATMLLGFLLHPDKGITDGTAFVKNLFIAAALLLSYNFIFTLFNELNFVLLGNQWGYKYVVLGDIFDLDEEDEEDKVGILNRLIFNTSTSEVDPGKIMAAGVAKLFLIDTDGGNFCFEHVTQCYGDLKNCTFDHLTYYAYHMFDVTMPDDDDILDGADAAEWKDYNKLTTSKAKEIWPSSGESLTGRTFRIKGVYIPVLGLLLAAFISYSMLGASVQVAIRAFKLLILQILAPIAIINTITDPKGVEGEKFKTFYQEYIKIFIEAAVRMATILLISVFITNLLANVGVIFPDLSGTDAGFGTKLIVIVMMIIAGYVFANQVPAFVDKVLSTKFAEGGMKNALNSILGGFAGGFAGGAAAGGLGAGLAGGLKGMGQGLKAVKDNGGKGGKISESFKTGKQTGTTLGTNIAGKGGLGNYIGAGIQDHLPIFGNAGKERRAQRIARKQEKLNAYDDAVKQAVKNKKMEEDSKVNVYDKDGKVVGKKDAKNQYSAGFNQVKLGEDKDAYAAKMVNYDKDYQNAVADYDRISKDDSAIRTAEADLQAAKDRKAKADESKNAAEIKKKSAQDTLAKIKAKEDSAVQTKADAQTKLSDAEKAKADAVTDLENKKTDAANQKSKMQANVDVASAAKQAAEATLKTKEKQLANAKTDSERQKIQTEIDSINHNIDQYTDIITTNNDQMDALDRDVAAAEKVVVQCDNDIAAAQTTITQCDTILADASSDRTATEQQIADLDIEIQVAEKNSTEAQADIDKAEGPNGTIAKAKEEHAAAVQKAKENAQDARVEAEKRAKDYYDEQKNIVHETDEHVKTTYQEYVKANGGDEDSIIQETKTVVVGTDANGNEQTKEVQVIKVADEKERNYNDLNATRDKINTNKK